MLLSQKLASFTKGQADSLRKGMGKKKKEILDKLKPRFFEGCRQNGVEDSKIDKIWNDWEAFAKYAFNKSHSTCYAVVSYRMAYLKAHYPAEFMAAVLSRNLSDIKKITFFLDECKHQNIAVLGPDINESHSNFTVNKQGGIRFGMSAIKGLGEAAVKFIIEERDENGPFKSLFDFTKRVNLRAVNKRSMEALAMAGAFDAFEGVHRAQYFHTDSNSEVTFLEKVVRSASQYQEKQASAQNSLFGGEEGLEIKDPTVPDCEPWDKLYRLQKEKEVTGFYITGHPLDDFRFEIDSFSNITLEDLSPITIGKHKNSFVTFAGMITAVEHRTTKTGKPFGSFTLEDFNDSFRFTLFSEEYLKFKHFLNMDSFVLIKAKIEPNRQNKTRMEIRISHMSLLVDAMEKFAKNIHLSVELPKLNEDLIKQIKKLIKSNPGDSTLMFKIADREDDISISFHPKKAKVNPQGIMAGIADMEELSFEVKQ
jgi:DNA polymerase-3 subunit alpha